MSEVSRGHSKRAKPIRLRCYAWKQWKTGKRRFAELRRLGISKDLAAQTAGSRKTLLAHQPQPGPEHGALPSVPDRAGASPAPGT
jgi:hypothetical protein